MPYHLLIYIFVLFEQFAIVKVKLDVRCKKCRMYLVKTKYQVVMKMAKMSPRKKFKSKPILITLQATF